MERVLITGGAGYIGSLLAPMLLEQGHQVTIYDSFLFGALPLLSFSRHPGLRIVKGDIRNADEVARAIEGQDWVFHLAAIVGYPPARPIPTWPRRPTSTAHATSWRRCGRARSWSSPRPGRPTAR